MIDRDKVIKELESLRDICNAKSNMAIGNGKVAWAGYANTADDALALLKEQEGYVSVPFSWLVKFCTHIDFVEPLTDAEREVAWRQKLRQQFGINVSKGGEVGMIDRESIIKKCQECIDSGEPSLDYSFYYAIIRLLKEQPEIVRCKDCMYYNNESFKCPSFTPGPNWFCAYGKRLVRSDE